MQTISGSACQRCHVNILAVSMGEFPKTVHGTDELGGEFFGRIGFLFILLAGQHGPRKGIVYGKHI